MLVSAGIVRLTAPNPSLMTGSGTNTYIVGNGDVAVIDPGPDDERHIAAIEREIAAIGGQLVLILVTHSHVDHLPGAFVLQQRRGVPIAAYNQALGVDVALRDGQDVAIGGFGFRVLHTPGHAADHLAFYLPEQRELFSGDLIVGEGTVVIGRDGELEAYLTSLARLLPLELRRIYPGHGPVIDDPRERIEQYIAHRHAREHAILQVLSDQPCSVAELVRRVYPDIDERLTPVAALTVEAHLRKLLHGGVILAQPAAAGTSYRLAAEADPSR